MVAPPPRGQARAIEREESPCLRSLLVSRALARGQVGAILSPPSSFCFEHVGFRLTCTSPRLGVTCGQGFDRLLVFLSAWVDSPIV